MRREIQHPDNWFFGPRVVYRRRQLAEIGYFDRVARLALRWLGAGNVLVLALITLRMRPMSIYALLKSWWWMRLSRRGQWAARRHRLAATVGHGLA